MSKLKSVFVVLLLVLPAGGGAFYGLNLYVQAEVASQTEARLAKAESLLLDSLRVEAFGLLQKMSVLQRDSAAAAAVEQIPSTEGLSEEALKAALQPVHDRVASRVAALQTQVKVANLTLLSPAGTVLAQAPGDAFGKSFKGLPAIKDCTNGTIRDGLYELDGKLTMLGVAPLENERGKIAGCWMTSVLVDNSTATRLAKACGMDVAILLKKKVIATTLAAEASQALSPLVDGQNPLRFGKPSGPAPLLVDLSNQAFVARSIQVPGGTDPVHLAVIVNQASSMAGLQKAQMMIFYGTGALFIFGLLLALLLSGRKIDKQFERLRDSVRLMAEGNGYSLDPESYSDPYHDLARDLKRIAETGRPAPQVRGPETVSQILGTGPQAGPGDMAPAPAEESGSLDFESLLGGDASSSPPPAAAPMTPQAPVAPPAAPAITPAPRVQAPSLDDFAAPAPLATPSAPPAAAPSAPPPAAAAGKGPRVDMPGDLASFFDDGDPEVTREVPEAASFDAPPPPPVAAAPSAPPPMADFGFEPPPELDDGDDEDDEGDERPDATVIAQVPDELLKAAATSSNEPDPTGAAAVPPPPTALPRPPVAPLGQARPASPDDAHFQDVFEQFVQTKQQCGESTAGLTMDKFVEKLRKNTADLKTRYSCKSVKFQVYVKNGKAALKATPIK